MATGPRRCVGTAMPCAIHRSRLRLERTYPAIATTASELRAGSFTLDGEAVVCGPDGVAVFDALRRRGTVSDAMLYAFDLLAIDGEDLRALSLGDRKTRLARRHDLPAGLPHGPGGHRVRSG